MPSCKQTGVASVLPECQHVKTVRLLHHDPYGMSFTYTVLKTWRCMRKAAMAMGSCKRAAARVNIDLLVSKLRTGSWFLIKNELQQQQQPMLALVFLTVILVRP